MKVAIIIGVKEYKYLETLPACKYDIELIKQIIQNTGQYDELLCISEHSKSTEVKE